MSETTRITAVRTTDELRGILQLQQQNLSGCLSPDVQREQGFVTLQYTLEQLQQMHDLGPSVIAKDGDRVVGYALTAVPAARPLIPALETLFQMLETIFYAGRPLSSYPFYVVGQVCVAEGYRGTGLFNALYQHQRRLYGDKFRLFITDIAVRNTRSLRAHERVGFKVIHRFHEPDAGEQWALVVWDWQ